MRAAFASRAIGLLVTGLAADEASVLAGAVLLEVPFALAVPAKHSGRALGGKITGGVRAGGQSSLAQWYAHHGLHNLLRQGIHVTSVSTKMICLCSKSNTTFTVRPIFPLTTWAI